ncbi:uncharacterized protein LOC121369914 [Gigantopelta aegis]|uniref:uncharacterized protein LOC121369914 n=1 Tax=Gigantopelta aegis TaxID=1735272 RepID=UPI001B88C089|nr:uncharacterized protein LOC121369914 [Gigantopelta aegis]
MWTLICAFLLLIAQVIRGNARERIFQQEIHSLIRELQDQLDILSDEIYQERQEFMALWNIYLSKCRTHPKRRTTGKFEEIQLLKADIDQYDSNLKVLEKKLENAKYAFRSEEEMVGVRTRLSELDRHRHQLTYYLQKEKEYPLKLSDEAERLRHEIFFLTHVGDQKLDNMQPKPIQWIPVRFRPELSNQPKALLEVKIKACTPFEVECEIQDITALSDYSFIVTYFQHKVLRHFRRDGLLLGELSFPWYMRGSLALNASHALVGVPQNKTIMILSFNRNIEAKVHVKFDTECGWDIDVLDDYYIILCHRPNSIRVYTKEWHWVRMIWKDSQKEVLSNPWFLTVNPVRRQIMVSDSNYTGVSSFDEYGNLLWTTQEIDTASPRGMVVDPNGDWLVCDESGDVVNRLSPSGTYIEEVFQVKSPRALTWMVNRENSGVYQDRLLVGSTSGFIYVARLR